MAPLKLYEAYRIAVYQEFNFPGKTLEIDPSVLKRLIEIITELAGEDLILADSLRERYNVIL